MRRIVVAVMGTLSGLILLFSYHTSTNATSTIALGSPKPIGTPKASTKAATPSSTTTTTGPSSSQTSTAAATTAAPNDAAPNAATPTTAAPSTTAQAAVSGTFTGATASTRWGDVQVQITVSGGKITQAQAVQYPQGNGRDQEINAYALPVLAQEVTTAQSAQIDAVSGATVTSDGYIQSLQSALDQAHL